MTAAPRVVRRTTRRQLRAQRPLGQLRAARTPVGERALDWLASGTWSAALTADTLALSHGGNPLLRTRR